MRIIDLLNKIANGEEVPKKIKYHELAGNTFEELLENFKYFNDGYYFKTLNDEVEILEEDKEIEKLDLYLLSREENDATKNFKLTYNGVQSTFQETRDKINELIDKVNSLEKEGNE